MLRVFVSRGFLLQLWEESVTCLCVRARHVVIAACMSVQVRGRSLPSGGVLNFAAFALGLAGRIAHCRWAGNQPRG